MHEQDEKKLAAKKAAVLGENKKSFAILWVGLAIGLGLLLVFTLGFRPCCQFFSNVTQEPQAASGPQPADGQVAMPVADFDDGRARFFRYAHGDIEIRYFVVKSADGLIRAAFDACDVCWRANRGYAQDKDYMVCLNCGMRFLTSRVNEVAGGCNPAPLDRRVEDDTLYIAAKDIEAGAGFFNFSVRGGR
jgi:uncharacterized membrane protein